MAFKFNPTEQQKRYFHDVQILLGGQRRAEKAMEILRRAVDLWVMLRADSNTTREEQVRKLVLDNQTDAIKDLWQKHRAGDEDLSYKLPSLPRGSGGIKQKYKHMIKNWKVYSVNNISLCLRGKSFTSYDTFTQHITRFRKICFHYCAFMTKAAVDKITFNEIYKVFDKDKKAVNCERRIHKITGHGQFESKTLQFKDLPIEEEENTSDKGSDEDESSDEESDSDIDIIASTTPPSDEIINNAPKEDQFVEGLVLTYQTIEVQKLVPGSDPLYGHLEVTVRTSRLENLTVEGGLLERQEKTTCILPFHHVACSREEGLWIQMYCECYGRFHQIQPVFLHTRIKNSSGLWGPSHCCTYTQRSTLFVTPKVYEGRFYCSSRKSQTS